MNNNIKDEWFFVFPMQSKVSSNHVCDNSTFILISLAKSHVKFHIIPFVFA